jgi:AcrR family transcriptional regulator
VAGIKTRDALLEQGALLFARHGVAGVTARQLHEAVGARNESALHYHFGGREGLAMEILRIHVEAVEARRAPLAAAIEAGGRTGDVRSLVRALATPMAADLDDPLGRAHLRLVAQLSHPSLAYGPTFTIGEAPSGKAVVRWLWEALDDLPGPIAGERLAALRSELISLFGLRAQLLDDMPSDRAISSAELFFENLLDLLVAGLMAEPSAESLAAAEADPAMRPRRSSRRRPAESSTSTSTSSSTSALG